jgi:isocitrate/isopropylmalate dehydrogenase
MSKTIAVIPGDGIGPEIMNATLRVIDALDCGLSYEFVDAGMVALEKHGDLLPQATIDTIAKHRVALKGPLTTPIGGGFTSINVTLRRHFDLYANVRPAISFPGTKARYENIDVITVRENTEGAYLAEGQTLSEDGQVAQSIIRNTRKGSERIVRYAFEMARKKSRKNLSDLCAGLVGGLGLAPGANIGADAAIFEAVHGSAPDIAGKNIANPCALLLAAADMLDHLDMVAKGSRIRHAIREVMEARDRVTPDIGGTGSTETFADALVERIRASA